MKKTLPRPDGRMAYLDGLRGLMAFNVILCHFVVVYFPQMYSEQWSNSIGGGLSIFATTPLSVLINGNVAVQYFFTLTGFLVCKSVLQKSEIPLLYQIAKRYLRLFVVTAAAILFTFLTMVFSLQFHLEAAQYTLNKQFFLDYCNFSPSFLNLISDLFIMPFLRESKYVGPLWTVRYEFWGYLLCYVVCLIGKNTKWRRITYILASILSTTQLNNMNYVAFFIGAFVADLIYCDDVNATVLSKFYYTTIHSKAFLYFCGLLGIYLIACPLSFTSIYTFLSKIPFFTTSLARAMGNGLLLYVLLNCGVFQKALSNRTLLWFGKCSFSTYAFHWPIMLTLQAKLFLLFRGSMSYGSAAFLAFIITLPVIYLVSYVSWFFLERKELFHVDFLKPKGLNEEAKNC